MTRYRNIPPYRGYIFKNAHKRFGRMCEKAERAESAIRQSSSLCTVNSCYAFNVVRVNATQDSRSGGDWEGLDKPITYMR